MIPIQDVLHPLPHRQRIVALTVAIGVLLVVVELLRKRRLREEYSVLWVATAAALIVLALQQDLIVGLSRLFGAASSSSTLFFLALVFLMLLSLQFSVRLSRLTSRSKTLGQKIALLEQELRELRDAGPPDAAGRDRS